MNLKIFLKLAIVAVLTLVSLIPLGLIRTVIDDREENRRDALSTIREGYSGAQSILGPLLVIPYTDTFRELWSETDAHGRAHLKERNQREERSIIVFPESLKVDGQLDPEKRHSGLYDAILYQLTSQWQADYRIPELPKRENLVKRVLGEPYFVVGISDARGLVGRPAAKLDAVPLATREGSDLRGLRTGFHLPVTTPLVTGGTVHFEMAMTVGGTATVEFYPMGNDNDLQLRSSWPNPKFQGAFRPTDRKVDEQGFQAHWRVSSLSTTAQPWMQELAGRKEGSPPEPPSHYGGDVASGGFGVSLIEPVDTYQQVSRAVKYGILFIAITFIAFFLFEMVARLKIHPLQYLAVGLALTVFFLLLLALSERITLGWAYLASAAGCIGVITVYLAAILGWKRTLGFTGLLTTLYAALYGLLISEDNALVLGASLLFILLSAAMLMTRKVDWYAAGGSPGTKES